MYPTTEGRHNIKFKENIMATATRIRKAPTKVQETELTHKQVINAGIEKVVQATGVDTQKARYKAMRAIAFQAFLEAIKSEEFDALVDRAIAGIDELPAGWTMERSAKAEVAAKPAPANNAPARKTAASTAAAKATPAKAPARRRPARNA